MNKPIHFRGYGVNSVPVTIMHNAITYWYAIDYNGNTGTTVVLVGGKEIIVGHPEWEVASMMEVE